MRYLIVSTLMLFSVAATAQPSSEQMLERLSEELNLSPSQETQVAPILESFHEQMRALRDSGSDRRDQREQMHTLADERDEQLQQFLSEEQLEQFQQLEQQRHERRDNRRNKH